MQIKMRSLEPLDPLMCGAHRLQRGSHPSWLTHRNRSLVALPQERKKEKKMLLPD